MKGEVRLEKVELRLGETAFEFDIEIADGTFAAITGPSGSGKTTLFNLIAGFEEPESGNIYIGGERVNGRPPAKRPVSLIFQDYNLFAHLNVFSNVALGINPALRLGGDERERVETALKRVGLGGFGKRMPGSLSGGERQRVAFARALVRRRPVMLLDEPFASLDPELREEMGGLLSQLHKEDGATILMITHDHQEAERLADMRVQIDKGRIVRTGY